MFSGKTDPFYLENISSNHSETLLLLLLLCYCIIIEII